MTRVHHSRSRNGAHPSTVLGNRVSPRKKKPYKVVLEAVTQEKRKLHSILSYASNAPPGFGFIPAGHPEFTEWCKEQCRQRNLDVHVVSAKPRNKAHADPDKISHHVHRIGHHFPLEIIRLACNKFNYTFDEERGLRKGQDGNAVRWMEKQVEDYASRLSLKGGKETKDHISGAVRELFPKIPEADLSSIVNHAFKEGTDRVGNAKELSLARRVQLAVVAHIRHTYTDYDKILKTGTWLEARSKVEHVSLAKLKEWRDETGEESNELEDTFREVIVLDDDEASSDDETSSPDDERAQSMEIVFSRATARELQPEQYSSTASMHMRSERRAPRTIYVPRHPDPLPSSLPASPRVFSAAQPAPVVVRPQPPPIAIGDSRSVVRVEALQHAHNRPIDSRIRPVATQPISMLPQPTQFRDADGQLYNLEPIEVHHGPVRVAAPNGVSRVEYSAPLRSEYRHAYDRPPQVPQRLNSFDNRYQNRVSEAPISRRTSEQDMPMPSIEDSAEDLMSPRRVTESQHHVRQDKPYIPVKHGGLQSPRRKEFPTSIHHANSRYDEPTVKRMRPLCDGDETSLWIRPSHIGQPAQVHQREPMGPRRVQPPQEVVDLTSSPGRPLNGDRNIYPPVHGYPSTKTSGQLYPPAPTRVSPRPEARGVYYEPRQLSRSYVSEQNRMVERRLPPPIEFVPFREEEHPRRRVDRQSGRYA